MHFVTVSTGTNVQLVHCTTPGGILHAKVMVDLNTHWENFLADGSKVSEKEVSSLTYTKVL
jgi:hypothetical protein